MKVMREKRIGCILFLTAFLLASFLSGKRYVTKEGYVVSEKNVSPVILAKNFEEIEDAFETLDFSICIIPQKADILSAKKNNRGRLWQIAAENKHYVADALPTLRLASSNGKYIFYRSDSHLTSLGSYYAYKSLGTSLGIDTYGAEDFTVNVVKNDFSGNEASGILQGKDRVALFRYKGDTDFVTEDMLSGKKYADLYDFDKLCTDYAYNIFPPCGLGYSRITRGVDRENLLLVCDSSGNSLVPFLARHFDIDTVSVETFGGSVKELVKNNGYTTVLVCIGMDTAAGKRIYIK